MSVIIINSPIMGRSSCTEWLDEACETPLVSVLNVMILLLLLMVSVLLVMELLDMFVGKVKFTPPTRKRRLSLGISNGRSPKSTDVALPEAQPVCNTELINKYFIKINQSSYLIPLNPSSSQLWHIKWKILQVLW